MKKIMMLFSLAAIVGLSSCSEETTQPQATLQLPSTYDAKNFERNAGEQMGLINRLNTLVSEAKKGRYAGVAVDYSNLLSLYSANQPSLQSTTTSFYNELLIGNEGYLNQLALASGDTFNPVMPNIHGGVYGGYLFDENGLEPEQLIEKGLFGAFSYHQASMLLEELNEETADQVLALFGANPSFPNTPTAGNAANPDMHMANYAARRSDINNNNSLYRQMERAFIQLQAAAKAGDDFAAERNEAISQIKTIWERINAATIINYCHSVIAGMSATNPTEAQKASALHAASEAIGFLQGWKTLPQKHKIITDAQIDQLLALFLADAGNEALHELAVQPESVLPNFIQAIDLLKSIYGFSAEEIESFKTNYVSSQNR